MSGQHLSGQDSALERTLEAELRAESGAARDELERIDRFLERLPARPAPGGWRRLSSAGYRLAVLAGGLALVAAMGAYLAGVRGTSAGSPGPAASGPAGPSIAIAPYVMDVSVLDAPAKQRTVASPASCRDLETSWLRDICSYTLRADWRTILGPNEPVTDAGESSATWLAAEVRAVIDGDSSICDDVGFRQAYSRRPGSPSELPVAACRADLRARVANGRFQIGEQGDREGTTLYIHVAASASARLASAAPVTFDPAVSCVTATRTRGRCNADLRALENALGAQAATATEISIDDSDYSCLPATGECMLPGYGQDPAGGAIVALPRGQRTYDLNRDVSTGEIQAAIVGPVDPSVSPASPSPRALTKDEAIAVARRALPAWGGGETATATLGTYGQFVPDRNAKVSQPPADRPVWQVQFRGSGPAIAIVIVDAETGAVVESGVASGGG